jgi:hypothetical protein
MHLSPRTVAVGTPQALTVRLSGVPDPDVVASSSGAAAGTAGGPGGWLPGVSVTLTDPAGRPRPTAARLLWSDGSGGASVAIASAANGFAFEEAGAWNVTVAMELDSGGIGTAVATVAVVDVPPPQARMQTPVSDCICMDCMPV